MALPPGFDPLAVFRAAEVGLVLGPLEPAALTFGFAALAAVGFSAVALVAQVAPVGLIKLTAVQALSRPEAFMGDSKSRAALRSRLVRWRKQISRRSKKNQQNEEKFWLNALKKTEPYDTRFSNRWIYRTFRSAMTGSASSE